MLADLQALVETESPSVDLNAVRRSADVVARIGTDRLGKPPERLVIEGCSHLRWKFGTGQRRALLLAHHDTVWPIGSLRSHPWSNSGGVVTGPGSFDMKAGLVVAWHALAALRAADEESGSPALDGVTLLVTGDEEIGSTTSRTLIEDEARGCAAVFVLEASGPGGALKTARKGMSRYRLQITGRAVHAGLEPEKGVNAGIELAHQVLAISALTGTADIDGQAAVVPAGHVQAGAGARGTTVTPTASAAGTAANTVPATAVVDIDCRV